MSLLSTRTIPAILLLLALAGCAFAASPQRRIDNATRWLCYYGDDRRVLDLRDYDLMILETEGVGDLSAADKSGRLCVGYMSVGEVESGRWFWPDIKDHPWVLDANPQWPESRMVDPRSPEWKDLLLDGVAAGIMEAGYDGFFLDNVDTAEELLRRDPGKYRDADRAMEDIIRSLRERYPGAIIIANGGLSIAPGLADALDAVMYEGTVSTWKPRDDGGYDYGELTPRQKAWLRPRLRRVRAAGLPVLALEYVASADPAEEERVREAVRRMGGNPYVSLRALDTFPGSGLLPSLGAERD